MSVKSENELVKIRKLLTLILKDVLHRRNRNESEADVVK